MVKIQLKDDERIDFLIKKGLKIIQSPSVFSFSLDAVFLGNFAYLPIQKGKIVDLCTGNGAIALILSTRSKVDIIGVEIQERLHDMAERSVKVNQLENQIQMIKGNIIDAPELIGKETVDAITCNPPYFASKNTHDYNQNEHLAIARHEIHCSLEDVIRTCHLLLKNGGKVSIVHRPNRLIDLISLMKAYKLEPKRLQLIYPNKNKEANMLLIEGVKDGKPDLRILPPVYVHGDDGSYSEEVRAMLEGMNQNG